MLCEIFFLITCIFKYNQVTLKIKFNKIKVDGTIKLKEKKN